MFFDIFWVTYVPIAIIVLDLVGGWLKGSFQRLHAYERLAIANRRRKSAAAPARANAGQ